MRAGRCGCPGHRRIRSGRGRDPVELPLRWANRMVDCSMTAFCRTFLRNGISLAFWFCMSHAQAQTEAASQLTSKSELRAGLIVSNPVLVTRGADGQLGGVSVELARALAAKINVPVRLIPYENPARYNDSLGKDEWDIGLAAR